MILIIIASISLNLLVRNVKRSDIDCPRDTISYNCSIQSNGETVHLVWNITLPGSMPITIRYDNTSILNNMNNLAMSISTMLTQYRNDEYIESLLILTVLRNVSMNGTRLDCIIEELDNKTLFIFVNSSGFYNYYSITILTVSRFNNLSRIYS